MKKFLLSILSIFAVLSVVNAQGLDPQRIANLQKLIDKAPKVCEIADVDEYAGAAGAAAVLAIANSKQLEDFNAQIAAGNPPALADVETLAKTIATEKEAIQKASELAPKAAQAIKDEGEKAKSGGMKEKMAAASD